ncbi:MAG: rod shape-determining protein MreD [Bacteroidales bacterium]|nr:rod shape-determining protein MreD [Bacteroidales bacterium]
MNKLITSNLLRFLILFFLQILILNKITIFGCASPFLYLMFILMLPTNTNRMAMIGVAFVTGLGIDIFCNVLGLHAFACTLMALCRILFGNRILTHGEKDDVDVPSIYAVSGQQFITYMIVMLLIFFFTYFSLEIFEYGDIWRIILNTAMSTLLTGGLILLAQLLTIKKKQ